MKYKRFFLAVSLFLVFLHLLTADVSAAAETTWPDNEIIIQIDPTQNRITVLVNGLPWKKYRIAMGKPETPTPVGEWKVMDKHVNWGSGFGTRWIGLNVPWGTYGIHGTNRPGSIGHDASHGCIRMLNRNVEELYRYVRIGTRVIILGHPLRESQMDPRRLAAGDSGSDVLLIQNRLRGAGFFRGPCNGKFGFSTQQALKSYEKANGLLVDGVVGFHDYQSLGLLE
jgi:hypothetical protein